MSFTAFLQELWQHKLDWDEPLFDNLKTHWATIATSLQSIQTFTINWPVELMAAVNGSRLFKFILFLLSPIYNNIPVYIWSDSQIVSYWINSSKKLPQFVS